MVLCYSQVVPAGLIHSKLTLENLRLRKPQDLPKVSALVAADLGLELGSVCLPALL